MKRVLLSGVGGSIAAHFLIHFLEKTDWHIVGIDSFRHKGWTDRIKVVLDMDPSWKERLTIITHDLSAPISPLMAEKIGHIDYIIAMASLSDVEASIQNPVPFIQNNVNLTLNLLEYARESKPSVFVQISTDEVYGAVSSKHDDLRIEWDPIIPSNPYAASKACQEAIAISYWRTYGVPVIITNTMNNFGEMQQSSKYPAMLQKWIAKGEKVIIHGEPDGQIGSRSYIHSRNFADAVLFLLQNTTPYLHKPLHSDRPDRYNIAGDMQLDNLELAKAIAELMGKELDYTIVDSHSQRAGHDLHYGLDNRKITEMGGNPPKSFNDSMKATLKWQTENPGWLRH